MSSAAYLRVSSDKQTALRQRESLKDLPIDRWFEDSEGYNPRDRADRRPAFQRLLRDVERGFIKTIHVASQDRFGTKDAYELGHFFTLLRRHDCRLLDASGKVLNADDDATVITSTVGALTSTREQKEKAGRVVSGKITKIRAGATYQGGNPPYGFDVACIGPEGAEKWRVVYEGHNRRLKVYPDGRTERFDGKRNRPPKELNDVLRLRPSIIAERVKYARLIFVWFAIENIAPGQIAARLNDLGVSPIFGPLWHRSVIRYMLANPAYLGYPTWNKASNSRFMEFCGGQIKTVNGQKTGRKRAETDQFRPDEPEYAPLTDQQTWDKVQNKLAALGEKYRSPKRAPRTAELWLRGLVTCGCCGRPMRAYIGSQQNGQPPGYSCASYMRYGKRNPFGCKQHHVPHDLLEALVLDYLTQAAPEVKSLLDAAEADDLEAARPLLEAIQRANEQLGGIWCEMVAFVEDYFRGNKARRRAGRKLSIEDLYSASYRQAKPRIEKAIAEKEAELETLLDGFAGLSPKLKERANRRGEALQEEIEALRRDLCDLRVPWDHLKEDLRERKAALDKAVSTLNEEGQHRQKAEALGSVVGEIVCHFQGQGKRRKLVSIEVVAVEGRATQPLTFPGETLQSDTRLGALAGGCLNMEPHMAEPRSEILKRFRRKIAEGRPIIGGGAGTGISAKFEEAGGIDLIVIYNSGRFRMAGHGSLAGLMPYGDANAIVLEMAAEVLPVVRRTPVLAGVCGTDPMRLMDRFLQRIKNAGFAGVQNFPTVGLIDGTFRVNLEETNFGYDKEVDMIHLARHLDLLTTPYVFTAEDARKMTEAGADILVAHMGLTTAGSIGARTAKTLDESVALIDAITEAAKQIRKDVIILCHGGPIAEPDDAQYVLSKCQAVDGFYGASSMERLPTERAICKQTEAFTRIEKRSSTGHRKSVDGDEAPPLPRSEG